MWKEFLWTVIFLTKEQWYFLLKIFSIVSKVIPDCIGFGFPCFVIGLENWRLSLNQSDAKLTPITSFRRFTCFRRFCLSSHRLFRVFSCLLIGSCYYFGFCFTILNWEALWKDPTKLNNPRDLYILVIRMLFYQPKGKCATHNKLTYPNIFCTLSRSALRGTLTLLL